MGCRACCNEKGNEEVAIGVYRCAKCGALFGLCFMELSYDHVLPEFGESSGNDRYFDLTAFCGEGIFRRRGWYNPETKLTTRVC